MIKLVFVGLLFLLSTSSCNSIQKKSYISDFESFIANVEANYPNFSEEEWNEADEKFKKFQEDEYDEFAVEFTQKEKSKVNKLIGKYYAIKVKSGILKTKEELENTLERAKGFLHELTIDKPNQESEK